MFQKKGENQSNNLDEKNFIFQTDPNFFIEKDQKIVENPIKVEPL